MASRLVMSLALLVACCAFVLPAADQNAAPAVTAAPAEAAKPVWLTSYTQAQAQAQKEKKIILAAFVGSDWCSFCKKLEAEVFATPAFQTWAGKHFVLLSLDFPRELAQDDGTRRQNEELSQKYEVDRFPTVLFIDTEGKELSRIGYKPGGPDKWLPAAEALVGKQWNAAPATTPAAAATTTTPAAAATTTTPAAAATTTTPAAAAATATPAAAGAAAATAAVKSETGDKANAAGCEKHDAAGCEKKDAAACEKKAAATESKSAMGSCCGTSN